MLLGRAVPENVNCKLEHTYGLAELGRFCCLHFILLGFAKEPEWRVSGRVHSHVLGPVRVMDNVKQTKGKLRDCDAEVKGMNGKRVPNNMEHRIGAKTAGGDELDVKQERGQNFHESMMLFVHGTLCYSSSRSGGWM